MGILEIEIKNLNILRESDIDYHLLSKDREKTYSDIVSGFNNSQYMADSDSNITGSLYPDPENHEFYHKNNLGFLMLMMIAFFILSYYLHYVSKYNIKKAKSTNTESNITFMKYSNLQNLSIANFIRGMSIIFMVFSFNKNDNDIISFINFFVHIFPYLIYFTVFLSYIRFLIEKFYEIRTKKKDIFFDPTMQFFNILMYIVFTILTLYSLTTENYVQFFYLSNGLVSLLSLILALLFLYYGVRLANIYSNGKENGEMKEKKFIHNRVLFVSIIVGVFSFIKSIICFLIAVRFFNSTYPDFMDANLFDFFTFLFNEFMCSLIIGYTRQREDKLRNSDQFNLDSFDFNKNYQNFSGLLKGDLERELGNDLNDPLLDKIDKI